MPYSNIASSWYAQARKLRKLQNQNALLNHLANKYEILPEGVNCLSVEIVQEFLTAGHLNTTKSERS